MAMGSLGWRSAAVVLLLACAARVPVLPRLVRNVWTPPIPRAVGLRYPLTDEATLALHVSVVVGTKDALTPAFDQLAHLARTLPVGMRVIYTYPKPLSGDALAYEAALRDAAGELSANLMLLQVDSFSNPFSAWLAAAPHVQTKYTLLMHNDVFLLDARQHFLSELYGALEHHPDVAVAAPQIYETETQGLLTTHLFNTNLHLRIDASGVAFMSHEVDLLTGLSREPQDFTQRINRHFLEDHVFLTKTDLIDTSFIDPAAAFTLEYVDLQLNMIRRNLTQLYVPSARAEFRLWHFEWQDIAYFVRRRSEEQARRTKQHLETKWGVQFPNTGFCNFVKFSVIRHASFGSEALPSTWIDQASLVAAFFEMAGFNRHDASPLTTQPRAGPSYTMSDVSAPSTPTHNRNGISNNIVPDATLEELLVSMHKWSSPQTALATNSSETTASQLSGLTFASRRVLVPTTEVLTDSWKRSGIGDLLPFQDYAVRMETRYQVEHMSLALLRVPLGPDNPHLDASRIFPLCGLLIRTARQDVCWIYVAPHRYDHPAFQLIESLLGVLRVGPRIALALAMKLTNSELEPSAYKASMQRLRAAGIDVIMCGEHQWQCEVNYDFNSDAKLLLWQGRINSWPTAVRAVLPSAEELGYLYAIMALIFGLGAVINAYSPTQTKMTCAAILLIDWLLTLAAHDLDILRPYPAHGILVLWATQYGLLSVQTRRVAVALWLLVFILVNVGHISRFECLVLTTLGLVLYTTKRVYLAVLPLMAKHKSSLAIPMLARLVSSEHRISP